MTGLNHATTGALLAAATGIAFIALPLAFVSHFVLDATPHFGMEMDQDIFKRNKQKKIQLAVGLETFLAILALIFYPIILHSKRNWWYVLLVMLIAMTLDLVIFYRAIREIITKKLKPDGRLTTFHLGIENHYHNLILGIIWELFYFLVLITLIVHLRH